METLLPCVRFYKCLLHSKFVIIARYILLYVAESLDEMNVINFK